MGIVAGEATVLEVAYLRGKARSDRRGPLRWQPDRGHPARQRPPLGAFRREVLSRHLVDGGFLYFVTIGGASGGLGSGGGALTTAKAEAGMGRIWSTSPTEHFSNGH